jgi:hypothetical protein
VKRASAALALALAACGQEPELQGVEPSDGSAFDGARADPPPRGLDVTARRVFDGAPEDPNVFEATYLLPDRARWLMGSESRDARRILYRFGEAVYAVEPGAAGSSEYEGADRALVLRNMELYRALLAWPDGFAWSGAGNERSAHASDPTGEASFELRAELGPDGLPARVTALAPEGDELETLRVVEWSAPPRPAPVKLELWVGGARVYAERLQPLVRRVSLDESAFLPVDRVERPELGPVRSIRLPAHDERDFPLAEGATWAAARERADALLAEHADAVQRAGRRIASKPAFELDGACRPVAIRLRLEAAGQDALVPDGWGPTAGGPGLSVTARDADALGPAALRALLERAPPADRRAPGPAYARFRGDGAVQVVLPLPAE